MAFGIIVISFNILWPGQASNEDTTHIVSLPCWTSVLGFARLGIAFGAIGLAGAAAAVAGGSAAFHSRNLHSRELFGAPNHY